MAEALAVATTLVSVVGFAGHILQGCQTVAAFLDQIKEAPDDFRYFRAEVKIFQSILESYQTTLYMIDDSLDRSIREQAMLVLDQCNETVLGLQRLIDKIDHSRVPKWKNLALAFQAPKLEKHLQRIDRAKGSIIAARTNATFLHSYRISGLVQEANSRLSHKCSNFRATQDLSSTVQDQFHALRVSSQETKNVVRHLTDTMSARMDYLPIGVRGMVQSSLRDVLMDFYENSKEQVTNENFARHWDYNAHAEHQISNSEYGVSERSIVSRQSRRATVHTWFGVVTLRSTTTNFEETTTSRDLKPSSNTTNFSRTNLVVSFTPSFIRYGIYCSIARQTMGSAQPGADMKLRIYNVVQKSSSIVQACDEGDMAKMQMLFATGQASPFDRLDGEMSLLDLILLKVTVLRMRQEPSKALQMMENLCQMFEFLIEQGLDPGQLWAYAKSGIAPLPFLSVFSTFIPSQFSPLLLRLVRAIIRHSTQDPYYQADFTGIFSYWKSVFPNMPLGPVVDMVMNQEHWHIDMRHNSAPLVPLDILGLSIKPWFGYSLDPKEAIAALTSYFLKIQRIICTKAAGRAYDKFLCKYLIMCIEAGLDPLLPGDHHSLVSCLRYGNRLHVLRFALERLKWSEDEICDLFEADLCASLAYQLAHLHTDDPRSRGCHNSLQYRYVPPEDWEAYVKYLGSIVDWPRSQL